MSKLEMDRGNTPTLLSVAPEEGMQIFLLTTECEFSQYGVWICLSLRPMGSNNRERRRRHARRETPLNQWKTKTTHTCVSQN